MKTREQAIKWWNELYSNSFFNPYNKSELCKKYHGQFRRYSSLTGREIENIWKQETLTSS